MRPSSTGREGELTQTLSQISFTGLVALDDLLAAGSSDRSGSATVSDTITDGKHDPVEAYEVDEMKHLLADAINRMPDRERLVLTLYYYEGLTLAEIGKLSASPRVGCARSTPSRSCSCAVASRNPSASWSLPDCARSPLGARGAIGMFG